MEHERTNCEEGKTVQAVERALAIIEVLANMGAPAAITELAEKVQLKVSTVHRLLATLIRRSFVEQDVKTSKYKLALKIYEIGNAALYYTTDIRAKAKPYLEELVEKSNETANLAILDGGEVVFIDQVESNNLVIVKMFGKVGSRGPAYCTALGKVLLADLQEKELDTVLANTIFEKYTNDTITQPEKLKKELERVRREGYALDLGEREEGVRCVAAPVRDHEGRVVAAVSVSGPSPRITTYYLNNELIEIVRLEARKISTELGFIESVDK